MKVRVIRTTLHNPQTVGFKQSPPHLSLVFHQAAFEKSLSFSVTFPIL